MVLGGLAQAVVSVFVVVMDILTKILDFGIDGVKEMLSFQKAQPVAFGLLIGGFLLLFTITPFVVPIITGNDFNWNHVIYGKTEYSPTAVETELFLSEMSDAELDTLVDNIILVKSVPNGSASSIRRAREMFKVYFGVPQEEGMSVFSTIMSWEKGTEAYYNIQYEYCGALAYNASGKNKTIWEAVLKPVSPDLKGRLQMSVHNPSMRLHETRLSCYSLQVDPSTEINLTGTTRTDQVANLSAMMRNGSICADAPLSAMSREIANPTAEGGLFYFIYNFPPIKSVSRVFWGVLSLVKGWNETTYPATVQLDCYLILDRETRQRYYVSTPEWLLDTGDNAPLLANLYYAVQILNLPRVPLDDWQSIESIYIPTPIHHEPGLISPMQAPYDELKSLSNIVTLGSTANAWATFESIILAIAIIIIGLVGIVLVLNVKEIHV